MLTFAFICKKWSDLQNCRPTEHKYSTNLKIVFRVEQNVVTSITQLYTRGNDASQKKVRTNFVRDNYFLKDCQGKRLKSGSILP